MRKLMWVFVGLAVTSGVFARDDVPAALQPYMSQHEYRAAGLHKLNPAELAQFQAWFVRTMRAQPDSVPAAAASSATAPVESHPTAAAAPTEAAPAVASAGSMDEGERLFGSEPNDDLSELTARIIGTFNGWDGRTRFELDNGQVWETVRSTSRFTPLRPLENPEVTIKRGVFNSFRMQVEGYNRWAQVTRIE